MTGQNYYRAPGFLFQNIVFSVLGSVYQFSVCVHCSQRTTTAHIWHENLYSACKACKTAHHQQHTGLAVAQSSVRSAFLATCTLAGAGIFSMHTGVRYLESRALKINIRGVR